MGRLRLRYVTCGALFLTMGVAGMTGFSDRSAAVSLAAMEYGPAPVQSAPITAQQGGDNIVRASVPAAQFNAVQPALGPVRRVVTVKEGDALGVVLEREGVAKGESLEAIKALEAHYDPRKIRPGQDIEVSYNRTPDGARIFSGLAIAIDPLKTVHVDRMEDGFLSSLDEKDTKRVVRARSATIRNSLYGSASEAGIPKGIVADAIRIYSWNVDFQRDIQKGDRLDVLYETNETEDGFVAQTGNVLYARLILGGKEIPLYRFEMEDGRVDYFGPDGQSIKKTLMKTPIDGARMSSGFGMRRHPVLGYGKMHKGVDFAAPTGTPIYAAGDGTIQRAGRWSSFGNYVRIRHRDGLETAYAHMSRIAKGVKPGARVQQGEIIGYVGTTGRSTGPHLHYEVLVKGAQVNPNGVDLPVGEQLAGADLKRFKAMVEAADRQYAELSGTKQYAALLLPLTNGQAMYN